MSIYVSERVCACVNKCVNEREIEYECVCMCVNERERERERERVRERESMSFLGLYSTIHKILCYSYFCEFCSIIWYPQKSAVYFFSATFYGWWCEIKA